MCYDLCGITYAELPMRNDTISDNDNGFALRLLLLL